MCSRPQYTELTYMQGTGSCKPMSVIFDNVILSWYRSLNIRFGTNRTFYVPNIQVYRFDLCGRYQILWTDIANCSTDMPKANRIILRFVALCIRTQLLRTNGQTDIAQMPGNFALIKCLQGTQDLRSIFLGLPHVLTKSIYPLNSSLFAF